MMRILLFLKRPTDLDEDDDEEQHHLATHSAQAWVFDTGPVGGCVTEVTPCLRAQEPSSASNRPNKYLISRTPPQVRFLKTCQNSIF
jgi:hypothetical protein